MNRNIIFGCLLLLTNILSATGWRMERDRVDRLHDQFTDMQQQYAKEEAEFHRLVFGDAKREMERLAQDRIALQQQWIKLTMHP